MTNLEREIKTHILLALLNANKAIITDDSLRRAIISGFTHVTFSDTQVGDYIRSAKSDGLIASSEDKLWGRVWGLTPEGQNRAMQLL